MPHGRAGTGSPSSSQAVGGDASTSPAIPSRPPLGAHVTTDVCVVGAGIAGLSVAYELARAGKRVVVLEQWYRAWTILRGEPYHKDGER